MIIQLTGNVNFTITIDPSVWIFDDRKIVLEELYKEKTHNKISSDINYGTESDEIIKPPVNKSINRFEREKILTNSYVMPIKDFLNHAEIKDSAQKALLQTINGEKTITLNELKNSYLLFAIKGKPIKEDGPVHLYFSNSSITNEPIKGIKKITIL